MRLPVKAFARGLGLLAALELEAAPERWQQLGTELGARKLSLHVDGKRGTAIFAPPLCITEQELVTGRAVVRRSGVGRVRRQMTGKHSDKVVASIAEALEPLRDGMTIMVGGFGLSGNPEALIRGRRRARRARPDARLQQRGQPRQGARDRGCKRRHPQEGDLQLHRRERGSAHADGLRRGPGRDHAAGHPRRAHARRRRGHPGVLHADRCRARWSRRARRLREIDGRRYLLERALPGDVALVRAAKSRSLRQPPVLAHRAQLQSR